MALRPVKPSKRVLKIVLDTPFENESIYSQFRFPISLFHVNKAFSKPNNIRRKLVYDPSKKITHSSPQFVGNFENSNIGHVYQIAQNVYEIKVIPDPLASHSGFWFLFLVNNLLPGDYCFIITGFSRSLNFYNFGLQPVAKFESQPSWIRFGSQIKCFKWSSKPSSIYALTFSFTITNTDNAYFALSYPYTYSQMMNRISSLPYYIFCKSEGGVDFPIIFWNADVQGFTQIESGFGFTSPIIILAARHHPAECIGSYAMEGFLNAFCSTTEAAKLKSIYSFVILPMMNVDGVICGYSRPTLGGYDQNRVWIDPNRAKHHTEYLIVKELDKLAKTHRIVFLLDFHGHSAQSNAFTYGVDNESVRYNEYQYIFPQLMQRYCPIFDIDGGCTLIHTSYAQTMRVALHNRYSIPFSYTLEMSYGLCDCGPHAWTHLNERDYLRVGEATLTSLCSLFVDNPPDHAFLSDPPFPE